MQKQLKLSKTKFLLISLSCLSSACSSPLKYPDLKPNTEIMVRRDVMPSHESLAAGDHGTEFSNPVVHENTVVFGNRAVGLISIYPTLNQQRWQVPIKGGVVSELTVNQGSVYFGGGDGFLYSVNLENGHVNWKYDLRNPVISRPTVHSGRVFVTTSHDIVYGFDAGTGKWLWLYRRNSAVASSIYGASAPLVDGNEVLAGLSDGFLVALSLEEGQLKWEKRLHFGAKFTDVNAHPVLESGIIYLPSYDGALYALQRQGGQVLWRFDAGGSRDAILDQTRIFLPSSDGAIYCVQKSNAKLLWKFDLDGGVPTNAVITEHYVIAGSSYQYLYVLDKDTGKPLYRFNVGSGSGFYGSPAFDPEAKRLYTLSNSGNLYSFHLRPTDRRARPHGKTDPYHFYSFR